MPSFDIVCEVDLQKVDDAVNQVTREIANRFDFKRGKSSLCFDRANKIITLVADDELKMRSLHSILETRLAKRDIDLRALRYGDTQESGQSLRQVVTLCSGLSKDDAKQICKQIKVTGCKVQSQLQDEQVRVTGKKIDELQEVIAALKASDIGLPMQFVNMRR